MSVVLLPSPPSPCSLPVGEWLTHAPGTLTPSVHGPPPAQLMARFESPTLLFRRLLAEAGSYATGKVRVDCIQGLRKLGQLR